MIISKSLKFKNFLQGSIMHSSAFKALDSSSPPPPIKEFQGNIVTLYKYRHIHRHQNIQLQINQWAEETTVRQRSVTLDNILTIPRLIQKCKWITWPTNNSLFSDNQDYIQNWKQANSERKKTSEIETNWNVKLNRKSKRM